MQMPQTYLEELLPM